MLLHLGGDLFSRAGVPLSYRDAGEQVAEDVPVMQDPSMMENAINWSDIKGAIHPGKSKAQDNFNTSKNM